MICPVDIHKLIRIKIAHGSQGIALDGDEYEDRQKETGERYGEILFHMLRKESIEMEPPHLVERKRERKHNGRVRGRDRLDSSQ